MIGAAGALGGDAFATVVAEAQTSAIYRAVGKVKDAIVLTGLVNVQAAVKAQSLLWRGDAAEADFARDERIGLNSRRADADDVAVGGKALIADVNVVTAGGDAIASQITQRDVVGAAGVVEKRFHAIGSVFGAARVVEKRISAISGVDRAIRVKNKRINAIGCVVGAARVVQKRFHAIGSVTHAVGVVVKRLNTIGRVVVAAHR